jgi:hypothetical protein
MSTLVGTNLQYTCLHLGGWETEGGVSGGYGKGLSVDKLAQWIERIHYDGLDLSYLY